MSWTSDEAPQKVPISPLGWLRAALRALAIIALITLCLGLMMVLRLFERPLYGQARPLSPYITQFVCRACLVLMGIRYHRIGKPMAGAGAVVANHSSWLDIFALNAAKRIYFVAKAEVAGWPGIGTLGRATGTVFITRDPRLAAAHVDLFRERLGYGHKLLFFPEGTSTDGQQVLPFKPTLFAAFFDPALRETLSIQPVSVVYEAPAGYDRRVYGWWGDMDFGSHLLATLALARQGRVTVQYHPPVEVADFQDRKALAARLQQSVDEGVRDALQHRTG